jgi:hypothetical protein
MDFMPDVIAQCGFEWIYDKVERRFGTIAAWLVTLGLFTLLVGAVIAAIKAAI